MSLERKGEMRQSWKTRITRLWGGEEATQKIDGGKIRVTEAPAREISTGVGTHRPTLLPKERKELQPALYYVLTKGQVLVGVLRRRFLFRGLCLTCHLVICLLCFFRASCNIFTLFYWLLCSRKRWGSSSFQRQCEDTVILSGRSVTDDRCPPPSGNFFVKVECCREPQLSAPGSWMAVTEWSIQSGQRKFLPNSLQGR